jgi:hypothetical protein
MRRVMTLVSLVGVFLMSGCAGEVQPPRTAADRDYRKCFGKDANGKCKSYSPSVTQLVVRPEWYDGESVLTKGVLGHDIEEHALYSSREDYDRMNTSGAVWLSYPTQCDQCPSLVGKWVSVRGTFRALGSGHMGLFGGEIVDVKVRELPDYRHIPVPGPPPHRPPAK